MAVIVSGHELSLIRERTRAGMRAARASGSQIGRRKHFSDKAKATSSATRASARSRSHASQESELGESTNRFTVTTCLRQRFEATLMRAFDA